VSKRVVLPQPPDADESTYKNNQAAFNRAVTTWCRRVKGVLEDSSRVNDRPMAQQLVVNSYTTNTTLTGTSTLADVADFVCTLVDAMKAKGMSSQTVSRTGG